MEDRLGGDGWSVPAGQGLRVSNGPAWLEVLVRGGEVDGAMGVWVHHHPVIAQMRPHAHVNYMKIAYVLTGEYEFQVGEASMAGGPGSVVVIPRGSFHAFTTETGGRLLFVCAPAGNEEMFIQMEALTGEVTSAQMAQFWHRHGTMMADLPRDTPPGAEP